MPETDQPPRSLIHSPFWRAALVVVLLITGFVVVKVSDPKGWEFITLESVVWILTGFQLVAWRRRGGRFAGPSKDPDDYR